MTRFTPDPSVTGDGNKKLSKRDPQSNLFLYRDLGFLPEGLLNYLALLSGCSEMVRFLFVTEEGTFTPDPAAAAKALGPDAEPVLHAAVTALQALDEWTTEAIRGALTTSLVDGPGLKPKKAFTPVRVAVTGRTVSPPLYESMELLGKDRSIGRLLRALGAV